MLDFPVICDPIQEMDRKARQYVRPSMLRFDGAT